MKYKIESKHPLKSDWLHFKVFRQIYNSKAAAIAIAVEGVDDPEKQEVRVICVETGEVVWRSTDAKCEKPERFRAV